MLSRKRPLTAAEARAKLVSARAMLSLERKRVRELQTALEAAGTLLVEAKSRAARAAVQERDRIAAIAHRQLALWATHTALRGESNRAIPIGELVEWFDALSPAAREERLRAEARVDEGPPFAGTVVHRPEPEPSVF